MKDNTKVSISKNFSLSFLHEQATTLLYLPILGRRAFSVYMLLASLANDTYPLFFLLKVLGLSGAQFDTALKKVEAIGLISRWQNKQDNDNILLVLNPPQGAAKFKNNELLVGNLLKAIDNNTTFLDYLFAPFKLPFINWDNYLEKTTPFNHIYKYYEVSNLTITSLLATETTGPQIRSLFNYQALLRALPENILRSEKILFDDVFEHNLTQLCLHHQIKEAMVVPLIITLSTQKSLSFMHLKQQIIINEKNANTMAVSPTITDLDNFTPLEIVKTLSKSSGGFNLAEVNTITELSLRHADLPKGLLNALVIFMYRIKDKVLPPLNYIEVVLNEWLLKKNITTTAEARAFLLNEKITPQTTLKTKKPLTTSPATQKQREEWYNEMLTYIRNIPDGGTAD